MTMRDSELMKSLESDPVGWAVAASAEIERLWDTLALANEQIAKLCELSVAVRRMHDADEACGTGFYNDDQWLAAYYETAHRAGVVRDDA